MKKIDEELAIIANNLLTKTEKKVYRFKLFTKNQSGEVKIVGSSQLNEGSNCYWINLNLFPNLKISMFPSKTKQGRYLLTTKIQGKNCDQRKNRFWSILGSSHVIADKGVYELKFDLLDKIIFMSIYSDEPVTNNNQQNYKEIA